MSRRSSRCCRYRSSSGDRACLTRRNSARTFPGWLSSAFPGEQAHPTRPVKPLAVSDGDNLGAPAAAEWTAADLRFSIETFQLQPSLERLECRLQFLGRRCRSLSLRLVG